MSTTKMLTPSRMICLERPDEQLLPTEGRTTYPCVVQPPSGRSSDDRDEIRARTAAIRQAKEPKGRRGLSQAELDAVLPGGRRAERR